MPLRRITENPTIADTVLFDLACPDQNGCFPNDNRPGSLINPYKVNKVTIYYLEKSFVSPNYGEYTVTNMGGVDASLMAEYEAAKVTACTTPTEENLRALQILQQKVILQTTNDEIYYNDAKLVATFGDDSYPAWIGSDEENAFITHIDEDADGNPLYGHFELQWEPKGMREGNYFICWTWTPLPGGDSLTAHEYFSLNGATQITTSIPAHQTYRKKYTTLQDRYLPEMFKTWISNGDLTPQVLRGLNNAVASGFTFLEDLATQMVDTIDANATHESYLIPLANLFNIKLRSNDPTLWRRQIKRAIPLLKKKGTLSGLQEALAQANVDLLRLARLWQVISSYTWQEHFTVGDSLDFTLAKVIVAATSGSDTNYALYYRAVDATSWTQIAATYSELEPYVTFATSEGVTTMTWIGSEPEVGDSIRIIYKVAAVPGSTEQAIEDYIRALALMDLRDERDQLYPPKNWNVRVIEEDDPFFDVLIPLRHPYADYLIWGWVRTEFPYSENIYNMEEYNGSTRESYDPCDIDKDFVDPCKNGQSSKYTVDLSVGSISDDRLLEVQEILKEFMPFHAVLHSINLGGKVEDFVQPTDDLYIYIHIRGEDVTIAGNAQKIFNRVMVGAAQGRRDVLATMTPVPDDATKTGTGTNQAIQIYCPTVNFDHVGVNEAANVLEILTGADAGPYTIDNSHFHHADISGVVEPFSASSFAFRLSNTLKDTITTNIYQDDVFNFTDANQEFANLGIKTIWDTTATPSVIPWQVEITSPPSAVGTFTIANILPDDTLVLSDPTSALPVTTTTDIHYNLLNGSSETVISGTEGAIHVTRRGRVDVSSLTALTDIRNLAPVGTSYLDYLGTQYQVVGYVPSETHQFYISDYTGGDRVGVTTTLYGRVADNATGYLFYDGMVLTTAVDYESLFNIKNGANAPTDPNLITDNDLFKEDYLVLIGTDYYAISQWDGQEMYLVGPPLNWGVSVGTSVDYKIYHFVKQPWSVWEKITGHPTGQPETFIPAHDFTFIDRRGNEVFEVNIEDSGVPAFALATALNASKRNEQIDSVGQQETIGYTVEYRE